MPGRISFYAELGCELERATVIPLFPGDVKLGRNEPCWCGSGRKFKRCHLDRQAQARLPRQEALRASKKANSARVCLHPQANKETCTLVIGAHSVQKSTTGLNAIARSGHVYGFKINYSKIDENGGRFVPALLGIGEASKFNGFCSFHDSETFAPIERQSFSATAEQIALLGYRAICKEVMTKRSSLAMYPTLREGDRGLSLGSQVVWQAKMDMLEFGFQLGLKDLDAVKTQFEKLLTSKDYSRLRWLVIQFDGMPRFLVSSPLTPEFDFAGNRLQNLKDTTRNMEMLTYSLIGSADGGAAVFCWIGDLIAVEKFCTSLLTIPETQLPHRLVQFSLEYFENVYWSPDWWDSLDEETRHALVDRMNSQIWSDRRPDCLRDDGTRSASWKVADILRH